MLRGVQTTASRAWGAARSAVSGRGVVEARGARAMCTLAGSPVASTPVPHVVDMDDIAPGSGTEAVVVFAGRAGVSREVADRFAIPAAALEDFGGDIGDCAVAYVDEGRTGVKRVVLSGVGHEEGAAKDRGVALSHAAHHAVARLRSMRVTDATFILPSASRGESVVEHADAAHQIVKGALLSSYRFSRKSRHLPLPAHGLAAADADEPDKNPLLTSVTLAVAAGVKKEEVAAAAARCHELACAVNFSRSLANERADVATPSFLQHQLENMVLELAGGVGPAAAASIEVLDHYQLRLHGLNMLASVGQASKTSDALPRLVVVEYRGRPDSAERVALVGKGVTFDTGGLNLKPTGAIEDMHMDMGGAAAVMGALRVAMQRRLPVNIVAAVALAENAVDSLSYKPKSVLRSLKGLTVQVGNTDAEGRLCLADAMTYVQRKYAPTQLLDVATLTGACVVALGEYAAGLFSNDDRLRDALREAGGREGEVCWPMPVLPGHVAEIKECAHADLSSIGSGREGGACTAAAFLQQFVEDGVEWAHLDIAGVGMASKARSYHPAGGTGFGVQTLVSYLEERARA